jgi:hypothetical protein
LTNADGVNKIPTISLPLDKQVGLGDFLSDRANVMSVFRAARTCPDAELVCVRRGDESFLLINEEEPLAGLSHFTDVLIRHELREHSDELPVKMVHLKSRYTFSTNTKEIRNFLVVRHGESAESRWKLHELAATDKPEGVRSS